MSVNQTREHLRWPPCTDQLLHSIRQHSTLPSRLFDAGSLTVGRVFQSEIETSVAERMSHFVLLGLVLHHTVASIKQLSDIFQMLLMFYIIFNEFIVFRNHVVSGTLQGSLINQLITSGTYQSAVMLQKMYFEICGGLKYQPFMLGIHICY